MPKSIVNVDEKTKKKCENFTKNVNSEMHYKSEVIGDNMSLDWLNEIEFACPYIDNIIRNPKLALVNLDDIVKIEKARKTGVASVKDLSKHTSYIERIDPITNEVQPSKILIERHEETYNTYENRFVYTLIDNLLRLMMRKEALIESIEIQNTKVLEYAASTSLGSENINIEMKISSHEIPNGQDGNDFANEINAIKARIKAIGDYTSSWQRSALVEALDKAHVSFVIAPIKKTNIILKNPNFQIAMKLWEFVQNYDSKDSVGNAEGLDTAGNDILKGILDDSFLIDYFVLDSISSKKRDQKEKISKYAVVMIIKQIRRAVSLLLKNGIKITNEELLSIISSEIKSEKGKNSIGSTEVKNKFKKVMDEYLEKIQEYK